MSLKDATTFQLRCGVRVPLRDGIHLDATIYIPTSQDAPAPCVFTLTPYMSDVYHERGVYFATRGLPFAIVDVRGRGNSEGTFQQMIQEASPMINWRYIDSGPHTCML